MRVEAVEAPGPEWDAFVESRPDATLAHAGAWCGILRRAYRLVPCYLAARDGGLRGVLPLFRFRTLRGARELVSVPYLDAGGILADGAEAERALLGAALELARADGARALELRQPAPLQAGPAAPPVDRVDMVLPLARDAEAQWSAFPAKVRNQTRKAEREGLAIAEADPFEGFYRPFRENMRDLGSPVHAAAFYREAAHAFGERLRFVVVADGDRPVGGLVAIRYAGGVTVPWASTLRAERARCPNNLIYWEAIRWAVASGAGWFDFGRSPAGGGTHRFKKGWGAEERPLAWLRLAPDGSVTGMRSPGESGLLRRLASIWTRLPVGLTAIAGPPLRRFIAS